MSTLFVTGFPGFLGSELLPRALARAADHRAVCLVQPKFVELARRRAEELTASNRELRGRIEVVEGDITRPGLGLGDAPALRHDVTEVFHLAAVYDLGVGRDLAMRVNVEGTRNVLEFAASCPSLARVQYVSTCHVSGRYPGVFRETDLAKGQRFNNFYEETKYLAEDEVQRRMADGLPATVYRPPIVVGDSRTGATQKFDGPYFVIQWLLRQPRVAVMPVIGNPRETTVNVVPRDFVVDAIAHLGGRPESAGRVYQLADPNPLTVDEMLDVLAAAADRTILRLPLPRAVAKFAIDRVPGVYPLLRIPSTLIDYYVLPTRYETAHTLRDLRGSGIEVPPFASYAGAMVDFARRHPEIGAAAMA